MEDQPFYIHSYHQEWQQNAKLPSSTAQKPTTVCINLHGL